MRIIPTLLISNKELVKTISFDVERYIGDPLNAIKLFNDYQAHELMILDINCNEPDFNFLKKLASKSRMPISYGGGINTLEQALEIIKIGFDKVVLSRLLIKDSSEVKRIIKSLGSQSVVGCVEIKYDPQGSRILRLDPKRQLSAFIDDVAGSGVGEVFLYDTYNEGRQNGLKTREFVKDSLNIEVPVVIGGGLSSYEELVDITKMNFDAISVGSLFVFYGKRNAVLINYDIKKYGLY